MTTDEAESPRLAISTALAGGYSGAPVFSATDGEVFGMVASKVMEGEGTVWPAGISLAVLSSVIHNSFLQLFENTTAIIKGSLGQTL